MEDSLGLSLEPMKPIKEKKHSKISTNPTLNYQLFDEKKYKKSELVFPKNFEEKMKILRSLR
jgi:hypothetical protein